MKFIDLFAGIGGFRTGMEQAGHECAWSCEIDKYARQSYKAIFGGEPDASDIRRVSDDDIRQLGRERGPIQVICGGFPCQAFSVAGKRGGFSDTRGTLFFEIMRFASILRPNYLFLENVEGLLNHDEGNTFETILRTLDEVGYDAEWQVLNSKDFGVPQNRERVFIIGHLRGASTRKVFPFSGENGGSIEVVGRLDINGDDYIKRVYSVDGLSPALPTMQGGMQEPKVLVNTVIQKTHGATTTIKQNETGTLQAARLDKVPMVVCPVLTPDREEKRQNGRRLKEPGEPMFTLTAQDRHGVAIQQLNPGVPQSHRIYDICGISPTLCAANTNGGPVMPSILTNYRIRKLTPLECWRLQGQSDENFYKAKDAGVSDSQLYKQAGNSVTCTVIYEIAKRLEVSQWLMLTEAWHSRT